jgi:hypothetical protein
MNPACCSTNTAGRLPADKEDEACSLQLTYIYLQPRLRMSGAIPLPPYAFIKCGGTKFTMCCFPPAYSLNQIRANQASIAKSEFEQQAVGDI